MRKNIILAFFACFSLAIAVLIYLCFRPHNILFFRWLDFFGFNYSVFGNINIQPSNFIIYNLTNALFLIFGYIFVYIIWGKNKLYFLLYTSIITLLNIIYEIATHDMEDLITVVITFIICIIVYYIHLGVKHEKI